MKKELVKGITMLALIVVLAFATAVVSANAQSAQSAQSTNSVVADIPFEFSVGYKTMAAGEYNVQTVASAGNALLIQSGDGKELALRLSEVTDRLKTKTPARLIFHRYGERYFLAEVWNGADTTGRRLLRSQEERALESKLESVPATTDAGQSAYELVEVLAVRR